jgi:type II secretory pathway pseudopilin PulG
VRAAFTLIEVLAAVFLTAVVMTVAIAFSVNLNDSADAAAQKARQGRQALAVLDRVARDLEGAYLLSKPESLDPLGNPWIFVADSQTGDSASDRLQFVTRSYRPSNPLEHGSDLAVVSYLLHASPDAPGFDLLRSVSPGLPAGQNREFPSASDEAFILLAEGIDHFGLRFMSADFEWFEAWDSTQLEQSSALPRAAEIAIAYLPKLPPDADAFEDFGRIDLAKGETPLYERQVRLPLEAIDLDSMLAAALETEDAEGTPTTPQGDEDLDDDRRDESTPAATASPSAASVPPNLQLLEGFGAGQLKKLIP